ncbi:transcription initiation factor TFIID subunit 4-like [Prionailurus iriomotensis]
MTLHVSALVRLWLQNPSVNPAWGLEKIKGEPACEISLETLKHSVNQKE